MSNLIQEKAREQALIDWKDQKVVCWITGRVDIGKPALARGKLFYPSVYFARTDEDIQFYDTYNQKIDELIRQNGVPDWAPINRIPDKQLILDELKISGQSISMLEAISIRERNLVHSVLRSWTIQPLLWQRFPDRGLLILGGNDTEKVGRVDLLDVSNMKWLTTIELHRKHYPQMPWD